MGFGSEEKGTVRIDDDPTDGNAGYAVSTLATTPQAAKIAKRQRSELAQQSTILAFRFLSSPGFGILAAGGAIALVFWGLGSQRPDMQLAYKQTEMLERRLETLDRQTKLQTEQMGELSDMLRSATRPSNNFALVQWGMESNSAVMQGSQQPAQPVAVTYEELQRLTAWKEYCDGIQWAETRCTDMRPQLQQAGVIQ